MVAYGEFRKALDKDEQDQRLVFYGIRYIIENYIAKPWTMEDLEKAKLFFSTHKAGHGDFPFPVDLIEKFIKENNGYFPVTIEALPEGTVCYPHVPVYQITAEQEYAPLVTWLETVMSMVWYPSTVATLSRRSKHKINEAFQQSVDQDRFWLLESRLHDFGFRGCTCLEQSMLGGAAHLLSFEGTDTLSAAYYVQFELNNGKPIGTSIPATEHSIMTSWQTEREAILNMIEKYGDGLFACVMDSYDYANALEKVLPSIKTEKLKKGGLMVLRPDSGDPVETVLMALKASEKVFGCDLNKKGYKVLRGCAVIQGDGINYQTLQKILNAVLEAGFSAQNVAFGMGGGLLQKVNRDSMSFATKLSFIKQRGQKGRDIMKMPKTDPTKISLPGEMVVLKESDGKLSVVPKTEETKKDPRNIFHTVYDHGKVIQWESFEVVRQRVEKEWQQLLPILDVLSPEMKEKIEKCKKDLTQKINDMLNE